MGPTELSVAADYLEEGGFDRVAKMVRGQTEAAVWDSYVQAALCGAAANNGQYGKDSHQIARYAIDVASQCMEARQRRYPNGEARR